MGQNIGTDGRAWGKILGRCVVYTGVLTNIISNNTAFNNTLIQLSVVCLLSLNWFNHILSGKAGIIHY